MTTHEVLKLNNISFGVSRAGSAIVGLSLTLRAGEYQMLAAPPGSGGSSIMPMILGEVKLMSDLGTLLGYPLWRMSSSRRRQLLQQIGFIPRFDTIISDETLGEFVALPLHIAGLASNQIGSRVRSTLADLGLTLHSRQQMSALSPAERRLATLAQALVKSPKLIIVELRTDDLDRQVVTPILRRYASHGGAVLALVGELPVSAQLATATFVGSEVSIEG